MPLCTGGSPSTRNKGQAQLPACATHRRPAVAPAATGAMDTFIDMYQTLRDMRKRQLAHQVLSPHSAPLATCRRRLPLACAGIKRRRSAAARDLCALSTLSSCDPPQVLNLAMIVCSALMIWKVTRSYTCIYTRTYRCTGIIYVYAPIHMNAPICSSCCATQMTRAA